MEKHRKPSPIAVIGMGCLFPKASGIREYWRLISQGEDAITDVPASHWNAKDFYNEDQKTQDHLYCTRGGYLSPVSFNPAEFGIPPNIIEATDTSQLLSLVVAKMALEDAGYGIDKEFNRDKASVILGVTGTQELVITMGSRLSHPAWKKAIEDSGIPTEKKDEILERISDSFTPWQENSFPGLLGNVVAGRIANRFNFGGTNTVIDSACASSLSALNLAFMELQTGRSDIVLSGGVDALNDIFMHMCFSQTGVLSFSGDIKPFSESADGTILGEGIGMVVLKRLEDAEKDNDNIYAVLKSVGASSDGKALSIYAPSAKGQAKALKMAYSDADVDPSTVELVEAHGTGTKGDIVEFDGLRNIFAGTSEDKNWCALGTVKSNIGHTKAAAGAAGLLKGILSLHHKVLPPTLKIDEPAKELNISESPFYLSKTARPWLSKQEHPRRCGVSSCGFGGSNFHAVLEEYKKEKPIDSWDGSVEIIAFSADSLNTLKENVNSFVEKLDKDFVLEQTDKNFSYEAQTTRESFNHNHLYRLLIIINKTDKPFEVVTSAISEIEASSSGFNKQNIFFGTPETVNGKLGFIYPGQGSQYTGMSADLMNNFADASSVLEKSNALFDNSEEKLGNIIYPLPDHILDKKTSEAILRKTDNAQPAIGTISAAMTKLLTGFGLKPDATCGHSFGELSALFAAGWIDEETLIRLSVKRGKFMASCGNDAGTMLAVKAPVDELEDLINNSGIDVVLANKNSYEQGVLSGSFTAIEEADKLCKEKGFRTTKLPVAAAFHSSLVEAAAKPFEDELKNYTIKPTDIPVLSNTTGDFYPSTDIVKVKKLLGNQLLNPVEFVKNIENLYQSGVRTFVEVGPKTVLSGLIKAIMKNEDGRNINVISLDASSGRKSGISDFAKTICQLASAGFSINLSNWEEKIEKPKKQMMSVKLTGANKKPEAANRPKTTLEVPQSLVDEKINQLKPEMMEKIRQEMKLENNYADTAAQAVESKKTDTKKTGRITMNSNNKNQPTIINDALSVVQEGLRSMQAIQAQTAEAHNRFLDAQTEAGKTLQAMMEKTQQMAETAFNTIPTDNNYSVSSHQSTYAPAQTESIYTPAPIEATEEIGQPVTVSEAVETQPAQQPVTISAPSVSTTGLSKEIETTLLDVVSELTGYPVEMLGLEMDIEADLGIDSIKRVEILSSFEEKMPDLPGISPEVMSSLKTLGEITEYLAKVTGGATETPSQQSEVSQPAQTINNDKVQNSLLDVVSELTGYPVEMLGLEMDLEADLGIDSIKRVEILSTFEERVPDLPSADPERMSVLKTLGEIAAYLNELSGNVTITETATPQQHSGLNASLIQEAMLDVVSELTGYPVEMLGLEMDLEADLGIDSIKRVEILSTFEERVPECPSADPERMSILKTLGEITDYLNELSDGSNETPQTSQVPLTNQPDIDSIKTEMLNVVSELTGYPVEMLGLEMDLEADLGIDSIKRVEILSTFEERVPECPSADPERMSVLKTLGEITNYLYELSGGSASQKVAVVKQTEQPQAKTNTVDATKVKDNLLDVVSRLTGYPVEMLDLSMDIEADLGIDSIKRVEIMSEFEEVMPELPTVNPEVMGTLKTLGQICDYIAIPAVEETTVPETSIQTELQTVQKKATVDRQVITITETAINTNHPITIQASKKTYVSDDQSGLGIEIVKTLQEKDIQAELISDTTKISNTAGLVIIPDLKRNRKNLWNKKDETFLLDAFELTKQAGPDLIKASEENGAFFATITRFDGKFGFSEGKIKAPVTGGLAGLAKTAAIEWENVNCKAIDIAPTLKDNKAAAAKIVDELLNKGAVEVGLNPNQRFVFGLKSKMLQLKSDRINLGKNDVVVISGGAKGVTAATAIALAEKVNTSFVLLGRSGKPTEEPAFLSGVTDEKEIKKAILLNDFSGQKPTPVEVNKAYRKYMGAREITQTIAKIESVGSKAAYYSCDVRDSKAISKILNKARKNFGPVKAVIHGAGVLEDRFIIDKTPEQFTKVYSTKVNGLEALLKATQKDKLKYLVLFSSVSARIGNTGQVDYSVANEVLNKTGRFFAKTNPDCRVTSINWGPWDGGMVTSALKKEFARQNVELIPIAEGAQSMVAEMSGEKTEPVEIVIGATISQPVPEKTEKVTAVEEVPESDLTLSFKKDVDISSYPILNSHRINNTPVVPFALMTEWIGHSALHENPGYTLHGINDMRVLKGIKINGHAKTIRLLSGKGVQNGSFFEVPIEIRNGHSSDAVPVIHSKGTAVLANTVQSPPKYDIPLELLADKYDKDMAEAYDTVLFHGDDLKGIQKVEGCSSKGMVAKLHSAPPPSEWISDPLRSNWVADPLILDSAYQMAILWCYEEKGVASLPSFSKSYKQYTRAFPSDGITAVMEVNEVSDHKMKSDFTFLNSNNDVVATITGYEAIMDSSLIESFGKKAVEKKPEVLFDREMLLAYAIGNPSEAFGKEYKAFDNERIIARLPGPPYFFMDNVTSINHKAWDLKPGGWIESEYIIPEDEWYFKANRSNSMPFCILLEVALQPCGFLAAYAGSALRSDKQLKFRNLGGSAISHREVKKEDGKLTMRTKMKKVAEAAGMIIQEFDIQVLQNNNIIYEGETNFGFFTNATMKQQVGIRNPENTIYSPSAGELTRGESYDLRVEAPLTPEDKTIDPFLSASMPSKALLMLDSIDTFIPDGGPEKLGYIKGIKEVDPDEWFFKAHFLQDPVCPGSLGLESFIQLIKFTALKKWGHLAETHTFEFAPECKHNWIYRGQVVPKNKKVEVSAVITGIKDSEEPEITADGYLCVDGILIYEMKNFTLTLSKNRQ